MKNHWQLSAAMTVGLFLAANAPSYAAGDSLLLGCTGKIVRISGTTGATTATGSLVAKEVPLKGIAGCVVGQDSYVDTTSKTLVALAKSPSSDTQVVTLNAESLDVISRKKIALIGREEPRLIVDTSSGDTLLISDRLGKRLSLQALSKDLTAGTPFSLESALTSEAPYTDSEGQIIDGEKIYSKSGKLIDSVDAHSLRDAEFQKKFAGLMRTAPTGKQYIDVTYADSAGGRILFAVSWDMKSDRSEKGGVLVYDIATHTVLCRFVVDNPVAPFDGTSGTPTIHLTRDGKNVIVESYEWRSVANSGGGQSAVVRGKTGTLSIFSADSGTFVRKFELGREDGASGRLLKSSANGRYVFYSAGQTLYTLDLVVGSVSEAKLLQDFVPVAAISIE